MRTFLKTALCVMAATFAAAPAVAQMPDGPVTIVVPFPPGGSTDAVARVYAEKVTQLTGTTILVENRPGGATIPATMSVIGAAPDGKTLFLAGNSGILNPYLRSDAPFSLLTDMKPVSMLTKAGLILVVKGDHPAKTVADVIAEAKANPGKMQIGIPGLGSINHMAIERFKKDAGIEVVTVPFQGNAQQITALLGGVISVAIDTYTTVIGPLKDGKLRALAVTTKTRSPLLPDVPSMDESGVPGFDMDFFTGIYAPKDTPDSAIAALSDAFDKAANDPAIKEKMLTLGFETIGGEPEFMADYARQQDAYWSRFIKDNGLKLQ